MMRQARWTAALGALLAITFGPIAWSAELNGVPPEPPPPLAAGPRMVPAEHGCWMRWECGPNDCEWRRICPSRCPDRYSCFSLYGAYHPYGGTGFWGAYTDSGWGR